MQLFSSRWFEEQESLHPRFAVRTGKKFQSDYKIARRGRKNSRRTAKSSQKRSRAHNIEIIFQARVQ